MHRKFVNKLRGTSLLALLVVMAFITGFGELRGQYKIADGSDLLTLEQVPMEKAYMHLSAATLFSGEYLYYKFYNLNAATGRLSKISRVAYVTLVDPTGQEVVTQKLRLSKGMAYGDFFINTNLLTGDYTLLGYTRWMQNGGLEQVFHQKLRIINPYNTEQAEVPAVLRDDTMPELSSVGMGSANKLKLGSLLPEFAPTDGGLIELIMDTTTYTARAPFELRVRNFKGRLGHGEYSLTVTRLDSIPGPMAMSATQYGEAFAGVSKTIPKGVGDSILLPEQRGELIYGQVLSEGSPASNQELFLSIPGDQYVLKSNTTDTDGNFFSYLREPYDNERLIIQAPGKTDMEIVLKDVGQLDYSTLTWPAVALDSKMRQALVQRSIHNQLENAYFSVKPDSVPAPDLEDPFFGGIPEVFVLDDYTRFKTLEETLVEILNLVGYRKAPDGSSYIRVAQDFETFNEEFNTDPALVLIDGVYIPDPDLIRNFDARLIKRIKVLHDQMMLGGKPYQGVVYFETFEGDFAENYKGPNTLNTTLKLPQPQKLYFRQQFGQESEIFDQVPDFRSILLWEPELPIESPEVILKGFTSDLKGTFEAKLEGFTTYGKPISVRTRFVVK